MAGVEFFARNELESDRFGAALAEVLSPGMVVALIGNLGAGKTRLVRSVATALGIDPRTVHSPTFVLIQEHDGRLPVYHFDTYRLRDIDEFLELGADELMRGDGVCFIEWADRVAEALPRDCLRIEIEPVGPTERRFRATASGPMSQACLDRIQNSAC